jgi:DNA-binding XRE family transcriptional regulator
MTRPLEPDWCFLLVSIATRVKVRFRDNPCRLSRFVTSCLFFDRRNVMTGSEMKTLRKGVALTQEGLAKRLGVSRKTINEQEKSEEVDARTAIAVRAVAESMRLIEDTFWVQVTKNGTYGVARRTTREFPHAQAMYFSRSELMLYGEFERRDHAYRWCAALRNADSPRNTKKLLRQRAAEFAERQEREQIFA